MTIRNWAAASAAAAIIALSAILATEYNARASVGTQNTTIAAANLAVDANTTLPTTLLAATLPGGTLAGGGGTVIDIQGRIAQPNAADTLTIDVTIAQGANSLTRSYPIPVGTLSTYGNAFRLGMGIAQRDAGALVYVIDATVGGTSATSNTAAWGTAPSFASSTAESVGAGNLGAALDFSQPIGVTVAARWGTAAAGTNLRVTGAWATSR